MAIRQKGPRLGDYFLGHRRTKATFLDEINELINWQPINAFLCKKIRRKANAVGNPAYPPLAMFKILLLQRWYNLRDPGVEQALLDRLSFVRFTASPTRTTCRTRPPSAVTERLDPSEVLDTLLDMLNASLKTKASRREGAW
jgi:IS5 family transposase